MDVEALQASDGRQGQPATGDGPDPALFINRELSWLQFNDRVLQLAEDARVPLLERVKFCAIYTTNLDEYFMVRVAGLYDQIDAGVEAPSQDGLTPQQTIALIRETVLAQGRRLSECFESELRPALAEHEIRVVSVEELDAERRGELARHFQKAIFPALTPLAVAPGRPFPYISNLSLSLAVLVRDPATEQTVFARVKVPTEILPRFVTLASQRSGPTLLVPLEDVIAHHLDALFPGMEIADVDVFRVTRDADLEVSDDAADLLQAVEDELRRRRFGEVVRDDILQRHEQGGGRRRLLDGDEARQDLGRHLHAREHRLIGDGVAHQHRQAEGQVGDVGERTAGRHRQRGERGEDRLAEVLAQLRAATLIQIPHGDHVDVVVGQGGPQLSFEAVAQPLAKAEHALADQGDRLRRDAPVEARMLDAGVDLVAQTCDAHHVELVEVGGVDGAELDPLQERDPGILGELEHPIVEVQPGELTVQIERRVVLRDLTPFVVVVLAIAVHLFASSPRGATEATW